MIENCTASLHYYAAFGNGYTLTTEMVSSPHSKLPSEAKGKATSITLMYPSIMQRNGIRIFLPRLY